MPFSDLLGTYYAIQVEEKRFIDGKEGYKQAEYFYFIITVDNKEIIHMEQAALAYYLIENKLDHMAFPIQNIHGEWFTTYHDKKYMVIQAHEFQWERTLSPGELLAAFHEMGTNYSYEPQEISSYGQWKQLWIDKLTIFENKIEQEATNYPSNYYRCVMDVLPYIIGVSENAIQYIQESERDNRFHESDQGTIAFRRYTNNLEKPILWVDDLVYDHPSRDLAESVRFMLLNNREQSEVISFMDDYQSIRPLSVFSWRLLYARLIYPIPIFDLIDRGFSGNEEVDHLYKEMTELLDKQSNYEKKLHHFFEMVGVDHKALNIPMLHWL